MPVGEKKFRSSIFGGFNRDDVVEYIEKTAKKTAEYRSDSIKYQELLVSDTQLKQEYDELQAKYDELSSDVEALRSQAEKDSAELINAKERLAKAEALAAEYCAAKERLAQIEVDATKRAIAIEREAEEKAADMSLQCAEVLHRLKDEYLSASEDAEASAARIMSEVDHISEKLNALSSLLAENAETFSLLDVKGTSN